MKTHFTTFIKGLSLEIKIGVAKWEKYILQQVVLDLELESKIIFIHEDLSTCVDYANIHQLVLAFAKDNSFGLLESFADSLSLAMHKAYDLKKIKLTLSKPFIFPKTQSAGTILVREF